jgi:hypothetical protein
VSELKERFHFAKLTLSQVRYLSALSKELDENPSSATSVLYIQTMKESGHQVCPRPINQAVYLQMAYMNLCWLPEALTTDQRGKIRQEFTTGDFCRADFSKYTADRKVSQYFRHIRNSLAHASVEISEKKGQFGFEFHSKKEGSIVLSAEDLGRLSEKWLHRVSDMIYQN